MNKPSLIGFIDDPSAPQWMPYNAILMGNVIVTNLENEICPTLTCSRGRNSTKRHQEAPSCFLVHLNNTLHYRITLFSPVFFVIALFPFKFK